MSFSVNYKLLSSQLETNSTRIPTSTHFLHYLYYLYSPYLSSVGRNFTLRSIHLQSNPPKPTIAEIQKTTFETPIQACHASTPSVLHTRRNLAGVTRTTPYTTMHYPTSSGTNVSESPPSEIKNHLQQQSP